MTPSVLRIRPATDRDLDAVADLHVEAFPRHSLTAFGRPVVDDYYGLSQRAGSSMRLLVAELPAGGRSIVGFAAILEDPSAFYAGYRTRRLRVGALALPALVRHPAGCGRALAANRRAVASAGVPADHIELASLAVSTQHRGAGVGARLVQAACSVASDQGRATALWTDELGNDDVLRFYAGLGFAVHARRCFDRDRPLLLLVRNSSASLERAVS